MTWKKHSDEAMKALMDGDNGQAVQSWKSSVALIEKENVPPSVEIGQIYYYLGKCQADDGALSEAIRSMTRAEQIFQHVEPGHPNLKDIKYQLGLALNKAGDSEAATARLRFAKDLVAEPLAVCLQGDKKDDLDLKGTIKLLKKHGLVNELSPAVLKQIAKQLVEEGKGDPGDIEGLHPFDVLYCYYEAESRRGQDRVIALEYFEIEEHLAWLIDALNEQLEQIVFLAGDIAAIDNDGEPTYFMIIDRDEDGPVAVQVDDFWDVVLVFNAKLRHSKDPLRVVRLPSYDDREAVIVMPLAAAAKIFLAGGGQIFENLSEDLEPNEPDLVRLT